METQAQENLSIFMKILLLKRLESSFYAFQKSVGRFLGIYQQVIKAYEDGWVYISKKYSDILYAAISDDDENIIQQLLKEGKTTRHPAADFNQDFIKDLKSDLSILKKLQELWKTIQKDPKLEELLKQLKEKPILKNNHVIIFTESKETAEYLASKIKDNRSAPPLLLTSASADIKRRTVIKNFDTNTKEPENEYKILVATEILSEGVNLNRANSVINYDIPWNPTRMMQRVGRINRLSQTKKEIHIFNFFPTEQANDELALEEAAKGKIHAFLTLLGGDADLLTDGEPIDSHALFEKLHDQKILTGEDPSEAQNSELKYLQVIRDIRKQEPELFEKIKTLPKKARTARTADSGLLENKTPALLTYFRRGSIQKFFITADSKETKELDFSAAAQKFECLPRQSKEKISKWPYELLNKNKNEFQTVTSQEENILPPSGSGGQGNSNQIQKLLKLSMNNTKTLTDEQEDFLNKVMERLQQGSLSKKILKTTRQELEALKRDLLQPIKSTICLKEMYPGYTFGRSL